MAGTKRRRPATKANDASATPSEVRKVAKQCLETKGGLNNIVTLLELCESNSEETAYTAFMAMGHVYSTLLERGDLRKQKGGETDVKTQIATWLRENRSAYIQLAYRYLSHSEPAMQVAAFDSLMNIVKDESAVNNDFSNVMFPRIVESCMENTNMSEQLLTRIADDINTFADIRLYFYKNLGKYLSAVTDGGSAKARMNISTKRRKYSLPANKLTHVVTNAYAILSRLDDPAVEIDEQPAEYWYPRDSPAVSQKYAPASLVEHKRAFSDTWLAFLRQPMSADMHKRVLLALHKKIIPFMYRPVLLIDFLVDSYDQGGAVSMLALNGLFTLITDHNLDYPDFYKKLYALFDLNLLHVKYRSRFLRLVDLFLSSSQLPSYLIAAFVKRMARLSLAAPPAAIITIVPFAYNLLKKHPACLALIHRQTDSDSNITETTDPYLPDETDPAQSHALESSLWELQSLKSHYLPTIAGMVRVFEQPIAKQPLYDMEDFLDHSYTTLLESEVRKKPNGPTPAPPALAAQRHTVGIFSQPAGIADVSLFGLVN
ncbi:hypothetical protein HKX48_007513 [Thoreauomyces humboldtii]|nr:hypothetical protein HKX48_007513 [Thoreauomyces humboldtii]